MPEEKPIVLPKSYAETKDRLQNQWRETIFNERGNKCEVCGRDGKPIGPDHENPLELAHITAEELFFRERWHSLGENQALNDMVLGYSANNLLCLCSECHGLVTPKGRYYKFRTIWDPALKRLYEERNRLERLDSGPVREYLDAINGRPMNREVADRLKKNEAVKEYLDVQNKWSEKKAEVQRLGAQRQAAVRALMQKYIQARGWQSVADAIRLAEPDLLQDWMKAGYVPNERCQFPGGRQPMGLSEKQSCAWSDHDCEGATGPCWNCHVNYCQFHGPYHAVTYLQESIKIAASRRQSPVDAANTTMTKRWIEAGWIPSNKCVYPGGEEEFERYHTERCVTAGPIDCRGEIQWCPDCNITYCDRHGPEHRVKA